MRIAKTIGYLKGQFNWDVKNASWAAGYGFRPEPFGGMHPTLVCEKPDRWQARKCRGWNCSVPVVSGVVTVKGINKGRSTENFILQFHGGGEGVMSTRSFLETLSLATRDNSRFFFDGESSIEGLWTFTKHGANVLIVPCTRHLEVDYFGDER